MAGAGDRHVAEAGVKQVRVDAGIGVNENAFGGEALGAVTSDCVAVVEMAVLAGFELDLAIVVEACREPTIGMDGLDDREIPIGDAEGFVGRGELNTFTYRQFAFDRSIDANTGEAAGIIGDKFL